MRVGEEGHREAQQGPDELRHSHPGCSRAAQRNEGEQRWQQSSPGQGQENAKPARWFSSHVSLSQLRLHTALSLQPLVRLIRKSPLLDRQSGWAVCMGGMQFTLHL